MEGTASITSRQHERELIARAEEAIGAARDELRGSIEGGRLNMPRPIDVELENGVWTFGHFGGFFNTDDHRLFRFGDSRPEASTDGTITHEELSGETQAAIADALARGDHVRLDTAKELDDLPKREDGREYVCLVLQGTDGTKKRVPYRIEHAAYRMPDGRALTLDDLAAALAEQDARGSGDVELADAIAEIRNGLKQSIVVIGATTLVNTDVANDITRYPTDSDYTPDNPRVLDSRSWRDKRKESETGRKVVIETKYSLNVEDEAIRPLLGAPYLLTYYDMAVMSSYITLWVAFKEAQRAGIIDHPAFSTEQLWSVMTGDRSGHAHEQALQNIDNSMKKLIGIRLYVDYAQELRGRKVYPMGTPLAGQPIRSAKLDDYLIVVRRIVVETSNGQHSIGYEPYMDYPPILLEQAYGTGQYLTIDQNIIAGVCKKTGTRDRATLCRMYLLYRIRLMKNSGNSIRSRRITYDTVIDHMGGPTKSKRQRSADIDLINRTMDAIRDEGEFYQWHPYPNPEREDESSGSSHKKLGVQVTLNTRGRGSNNASDNHR